MKVFKCSFMHLREVTLEELADDLQKVLLSHPKLFFAATVKYPHSTTYLARLPEKKTDHTFITITYVLGCELHIENTG